LGVSVIDDTIVESKEALSKLLRMEDKVWDKVASIIWWFVRTHITDPE
jgi:hypothetical protein